MNDVRNAKTFDTLLRHWAMLRLIRRWPRKTPTTEIRDKLVDMGYPEVTLRTIQRDLVKLSGPFLLISDDNKPRGWSWSKDAKLLDLPAMDPHTALTIKIIAEFSQSLLPRTTMRYLKPHLNVADKVLENLTGTGHHSWVNKVRVVTKDQPLLPPEINPDVLEIVYTALFEDKRLSGQYRKRGESRYDDRELNPLGLVYKDSVAYLVATVGEYDDIRQFALHRFRAAEVLNQPSQTPKEFSLEKYVKSGEFQYPEGDIVRFKALFNFGAAIHLYETKLSSNQRLTNVDNDKVLVEATVQWTGQFRWWLLGFGDQVVVLEPKPLREELAGMVRRMTDNYGKII